jgi:membrane fusion protein, heavy metal efflux system
MSIKAKNTNSNNKFYANSIRTFNKKKQMKQHIANTLFFAGLITFLWNCGGKEKPTEGTAEIKKSFVLSDTMQKRLTISEAEMAQVVGQLRLNGKVAADEDKTVEVFPLVGGNVADVNVELGQYVEKGSVLAVIRSGEVADYSRQLIDAQSNVSVAEKVLSSTRDLFESKLTSEKDLLAAQKELEKAHAELRRINEVFNIYGITSNSEYTIKSPISGFVTKKHISRDMQLRSDRADNIFTIAQISDVNIIANVYETDISKVKLGIDAQIKIVAYPDSVFEGKIDRIYNILDPETKTMKIRIRMPNRSFMLKPEMNANIILVYNEGEKQMIKIPSNAVIFDKNSHFVMIYKDRYNIETRQVSVYKNVDSMTFIQSGLEAGEKVISKNQLFIYDALND